MGKPIHGHRPVASAYGLIYRPQFSIPVRDIRLGDMTAMHQLAKGEGQSLLDTRLYICMRVLILTTDTRYIIWRSLDVMGGN